MSSPFKTLVDWQGATLVMAMGARRPMPTPEELGAELDGIAERVRGNRNGKGAMGRDDVALLVEATLRRAMEIVEGR